MNAFRKFQLEMEQLEILHLGTLYAYDEATLRISERIQNGFVKSTDSIKRRLSPDYKYEVIASNSNSLKRKLKHLFPEYFREIILVRVISALEVFLIDTVKEIFIARKDLFHQNEQIEFSYAQILSFNSISEISTYLINKECRKLQNSGFIKISSYFSKQFKINFNKFPGNLETINECHERRHLLVHRLGRTDAKYRHDYNVSDKQLNVSKKYLIDCFETIRCFVDFIHAEVKNLIQIDPQVNKIEAPAIIYIEVQINNLIGEQAISPNQSFLCEDDVILVKDVVFSHIQNDGLHTLGIQGTIKHVNAYLKYIKNFKRDKSLKIIDVRFIRWVTSKQKNLSIEFLNKISEYLSDKPWSENLHKMVSTQFGISNKQARRAIGTIATKKLSKNTIQEIRNFLPEEPWPIGIHCEIAEHFGISQLEAHEMLRRIKLSNIAHKNDNV